MRQHKVWCVCAWRSVWGGMLGVGSWELVVQYTTPHRAPRSHTKRYVATLPQITPTILKKHIKTFKFSDFNKELRAP